MTMMVRRAAGTATILGLALIVIAAFVGSAATPARALSVETVPGNPTCAVGEFSVKDDPPSLAGFSNGAVSISYADEYTVASVTAADGYTIDAVIVKGGPNANVYTGGPYSNLVSPLNRGGQLPAISHVQVCYSGEGDTTTTTSPTTTSPTTTSPTTTTTSPGGHKKVEIDLSGECATNPDGSASYLLTVELEGEPGFSGWLRQDGNIRTPFALPDSGSLTVQLSGHSGNNAVWVLDTTEAIVGYDTVVLEDCSVPVASGATVNAQCDVNDGTAVYTVEVTVTGASGATGVVDVNGVTAGYELVDGSATVTVAGQAGTNTVTVTDDVAGAVHSEEVVLEDCGQTDVAPIGVEITPICKTSPGGTQVEVRVSLTGEPGAGGQVVVNGSAEPYTLDADGVDVVTVPATGPDLTVTVEDAEGAVLFGPTTMPAPDCQDQPEPPKDEPEPPKDEPEPPKDEPEPPTYQATGASAEGRCTAGETVSYAVTVTVSGEPGATGVVTASGTAVKYVIYDGGTAEVTVPAAVGTVDVTVVDDVAGLIHQGTVDIADCGQVEVLGSATGAGAGTSNAPDVAVLGAQIEQPAELPFTGPADGPLAAAGAILVAAGAVLLLATRSRTEDDADLMVGWNLR